ncbi:MAG: DUF2269 domain-containing protein [Chloroflexota bacterium]|nr:DUF2269 domain-containing protein [Chloroflexota bacterium]
MNTVYLLLKFLHIAAAIVWIGGTFTLAVLNARVGRTGDAAAIAALGRQSEFFGRVAIGPAMAVILIAGLVMVAQGRISFGSVWIIWGLAGVLVSGAISGAGIGRAAAALAELRSNAGPDDPRVIALQGRLMTLNVINLIVLLSVVWAMVFKPTL